MIKSVEIIRRVWCLVVVGRMNGVLVDLEVVVVVVVVVVAEKVVERKEGLWR